MIKPITNQEINQNKVASLPARPNASTSFGGVGYTSAQLKQAFDRLPLLLVERYNGLVEAIKEEGERGFLSQLPTPICDSDGNPYSLYEVLCHIESGDFATYCKIGEKYLDLALEGVAPLHSPAFLGTPTATTPSPEDNSESIATTAFVQEAVASLKKALESLPEAGAPEGDDAGKDTVTITVDQVYSPESEHPQSGKAVAEALAVLEVLCDYNLTTSRAYTDNKVKNLLRSTLTQVAGDSESLIMSQKAVTELVSDALGDGGGQPQTVESTEEMTDTEKQYVLAETGHIWAYGSCGKVPDFTNLAGTFQHGRLNSSGNIAETDAAGPLPENVIATVEYIPAQMGDVLRVQGFGDLLSYNTSLYLSSYAVQQTSRANVMPSYANYSYDASTEIATLTLIDKNTGYVRFSGIPSKATEDIIITKNEEITYSDGYGWYDTGLTPTPNGNYTNLLVKINQNTSLLEEIDHRVGAVEADSGIATVPTYWEETIAEKTETVKALQEMDGKDSVCFVFAADTHIPDNENGKTTHLGKLMAAMLEGCEIPFAVICGDIGTRASYDTKEKYLNTQKQIPLHLSPLWGTDKLLLALGNHDGCYGDSTAYYRRQLPPNKLWQTYFRGQALDSRRVFSDDGLYFFVDIPAQKTRCIVLNSNFGGTYAEDQNGLAQNNRFAVSCYGQAQLSWLSAVALDMPEGYGAVLFAHVPPNQTYTVDREQLYGILRAYAGKTTFSCSFTAGVEGWSNSQISVDFRDAKGELIGFFAGHVHGDSIDTTTLPCPIVTILSAGASANAPYDEAAPLRTPGTDTETSFDTVVICRKERKIHLVRVGAGADRELCY